MSLDLDPSPSQLRGLGSAVSSLAGSGAEPQSATILVHFRLKRKHLVLYKSLFSETVQLFKKRKFVIIVKEIILFPVRSGTQPDNPSNSVNSQISYHLTITCIKFEGA